ncbi:hypothetical protein AB0F11_27195 [Streptomyces sp. NPDC032472]|uniref:hypothetical protein n=1 Tax=Streptomyces sp. NPDC032472 TaxID=3155018 RepID=UPI0033F4F08D
MEAVVQRVRTSWTKQSRGGREAARRNAAPVSFPLPDVPPPFVHEVLMDERDGFRPRSATRRGLPEAAGGFDAAVLLDESDGFLRVLPAVTPFGMPKRWRRPPAVRLARGEWLRWQINHRFAGTHGDLWTYRLDTFNVAYGPVGAGLFLGAPTRRVDERAVLR